MTIKKRGVRKKMLWLLIPLGIYLGIVFIMYLMENRLVFIQTPASMMWQEPNHPDIQQVTFSSSDGNPIHAWWLPCRDSTCAVLLAHGNAGNVSEWGEPILQMRKYLQSSVLVFDYPGYGKSMGHPTEQSCYASAEAGWNWLREKGFAETQILLYGESLGGGIITELAKRYANRGLCLVKTFTTLPAVGQKIYPWLPVKWIMSTQFDNLSKLSQCRGPIFVVGADQDNIVPFELSEQLYAAAPEPKHFLKLYNHDHCDRVPELFYTELQKFLDRVESSSHQPKK